MTQSATTTEPDRARTTTPRQRCGGCEDTWTGTSTAHCAGCHHTFSGVTLFDRHRSNHGDRGRCTPPTELVDASGQPICELRDGKWCFPEMTDAAKAARFGAAE